MTNDEKLTLRGRARQAWFLWLLLAGVLWRTGLLSADEVPAQDTSDESGMRVNIPAATLGGKQFWADEFVHGSWRIQRNVLSGHYRLLDPDNTRRAWGTWDHCQDQWNEM